MRRTCARTLAIGKSGEQALKEPAAHDHYHGFNGHEDTIEWRSAKGAPFAVIVGWSFADQEHLDQGRAEEGATARGDASAARTDMHSRLHRPRRQSECQRPCPQGR